MLPSDDHAMAPRHWFPIWHAFDDSESFIPEEVVIYSLLPVEGHVGRGVACFWCCRKVNMYLYGWAFHAWERPVRARVECG